MSISIKKSSVLFFVLVSTVWIFSLRWSSFSRPAWNLDEGIHATIARSILDGGVMYRDAVDQRTPLTYYLAAGIFGVFGENNMWAFHAVLAAMIVAIATGIFLLARRWHGTTAAWWSGLIFCAFSTNLFYVGDAYSFNTEWFVILFVSWSAWWFWRGCDEPSLWKSALAGVGFAAAFLSKQPSLLEIGAPLATIAALAVTGRTNHRTWFLQITGLFAGWTATVAMVVIYFRLEGAYDDFVFYTWTYNLLYYGNETTIGDRLHALTMGLRLVWAHYPILAALMAAAVVRFAFKLVQIAAWRERHRDTPSEVYLMSWAFLAWIGSASSGRTYDHYYIQILPACAILTGWLIADCQIWLSKSQSLLSRLFAIILLGACGWSVIAIPLKGPWAPIPPPEPALPAGDFIRQHSASTDKIFVWGYNPDFYLYADRQAASRYNYCSFLTGLIPWTNAAPDIDTRYAIVPGTMDILLKELSVNRPEFIVDASVGSSRLFNKYPIEGFPLLRNFILKNYVVVAKNEFEPQGFRLHLIKDSARPTPLTLKGGSSTGTLVPPLISGAQKVDLTAAFYTVQAEHTKGQLQRVEILADHEVVDAVSFQPAEKMEVTFVVPFQKFGKGQHTLEARSTNSNGETQISVPFVVECGPQSLSADKLPAFSLRVAKQSLQPLEIRAPLGGYARMEDNQLVFGTHAPSRIRYAVNLRGASLRGRFGFKAGAWSPDNPSRTDGAEFIVETVLSDGTQVVLFRKLLRPVENPEDRAEQEFSLNLPAGVVELQFSITNGPAGNASSDWTYWSDLLLNSSR